MSDPAPTAQSAPAAPSFAEWLEDAILSGHFPPGSRIDLGTLADRHAVGWGEVREAALLLRSDGLADLEEGNALRVAPVSLADLKDLTATRIVVESAVLQQSIRAGDGAWLMRVQAAFAGLEAVEPLATDGPPEIIRAWEAANAGFHTALNSACPLRRLAEYGRHLFKQHQRYRHLALLGRRDNPRDVQSEHRALYDAALAGDTETATAVLARHIALTEQDVAATIRRGAWFGIQSPA